MFKCLLIALFFVSPYVNAFLAPLPGDYEKVFRDEKLYFTCENDPVALEYSIPYEAKVLYADYTRNTLTVGDGKSPPLEFYIKWIPEGTDYAQHMDTIFTNLIGMKDGQTKESITIITETYSGGVGFIEQQVYVLTDNSHEDSIIYCECYCHKLFNWHVFTCIKKECTQDDIDKSPYSRSSNKSYYIRGFDTVPFHALKTMRMEKGES